LDGILAAQRLDVHDIEGIHHLYQAVVARDQQELHHPLDAPQLQQPRLADGGQPLMTDATSPVLKAEDPRSATADAAADAEHRRALSLLAALPEADQLAVMRDYLIAATAKDCSIMLALQASRAAAPLPSQSHLRVSAGPVPRATGASLATGHLRMSDRTVIVFKVRRCCGVTLSSCLEAHALLTAG
jgi:hypothetical protein